ncbi:MAG: Spy/CpxP family protein refolding chaperone [Acidiphilium sp.]|nr:Spy/CpxP family protein refolding chaperone [Acidiphilium sp.]MDD4934708.1 Spy/CpxP family protein refolding chaperone [Acidiphilium sp.]
MFKLANHKPALAAALLTAGLGLATLGHQARAATATTPATGTTTAMTPAQKTMIAHIDAHLATLKKSIGITPDEEASWHGFTQVSRTNALNLASMYEARAKALGTMNAMQNMESYAAISAKNADDMNALSAAFQTLYTKLTPAQQKKIDASFRARAEAMNAKHLKKMKHN